MSFSFDNNLSPEVSAFSFKSLSSQEATTRFASTSPSSTDSIGSASTLPSLNSYNELVEPPRGRITISILPSDDTEEITSLADFYSLHPDSIKCNSAVSPLKDVYQSDSYGAALTLYMSESTASALRRASQGTFEVGHSAIYVALWLETDSTVNSSLGLRSSTTSSASNEMNREVLRDCTYSPVSHVFLAQTCLLPSSMASKASVISADSLADKKDKDMLAHSANVSSVPSVGSRKNLGQSKTTQKIPTALTPATSGASVNIVTRTHVLSSRVVYIAPSASHFGLQLHSATYFFLPVPAYKLSRSSGCSMYSKKSPTVHYSIVRLPSLSNPIMSNLSISTSLFPSCSSASSSSSLSASSTLTFSSHFDDLDVDTEKGTFRLQHNAIFRALASQLGRNTLGNIHQSLSLSQTLVVYIPRNVSGGFSQNSSSSTFCVLKAPSNTFLSPIHGLGGGIQEDLVSHTPLELKTRNEQYYDSSKCLIFLSRFSLPDLSPPSNISSTSLSLLDRLLSSGFLRNWIVLSSSEASTGSVFTQIPFRQFMNQVLTPDKTFLHASVSTSIPTCLAPIAQVHPRHDSLFSTTPFSSPTLLFTSLASGLREILMSYDKTVVLQLFGIFFATFYRTHLQNGLSATTHQSLAVSALQRFYSLLPSTIPSLSTSTFPTPLSETHVSYSSFRLGCLLSGPAGSGKQTLVRRLCTLFGISIVSIRFRDITRREQSIDPVLHAYPVPPLSLLSPTETTEDSLIHTTTGRYTATVSILLDALKQTKTSTDRFFPHFHGVLVLMKDAHEVFPHDALSTGDDVAVAKAVADVLSGKFDKSAERIWPTSTPLPLLFLGTTNSLLKVSKRAREEKSCGVTPLFSSQIELPAPARNNLKRSVCFRLCQVYQQGFIPVSTNLLHACKDILRNLDQLTSSSLGMLSFQQYHEQSRQPLHSSSFIDTSISSRLHALLDELFKTNEASYEISRAMVEGAIRSTRLLLLQQRANRIYTSPVEITIETLEWVYTTLGTSTRSSEHLLTWDEFEAKQPKQYKPSEEKTSQLGFSTLSDFNSIVGLSESKQLLREAFSITSVSTNSLAAITSESSESSTTQPAGVLLYGPAGCGKSLLARAMMKESKLPVFELALAQILRSGVGESEKYLRRVFTAAHASSPSIIFLDDIHSIFPNSTLLGDVDDETGALPTVLAEFLNLLDATLQNETSTKHRVYVLATAPHPSIVQSAVVTSGRLDCHIKIPKPDKKDRASFLWRFFLQHDMLQKVLWEDITQGITQEARVAQTEFISQTVSKISSKKITAENAQKLKKIILNSLKEKTSGLFRLGEHIYQLRAPFKKDLDIYLLIKLMRGFSYAQMEQALTEAQREAQIRSILDSSSTSLDTHSGSVNYFTMSALVKSIKFIALTLSE